MKMMIKTH